MKPIKILFVLFLATATLLSCNKDDDDNQVTPEPSIVGTWQLMAKTMNDEPDPLDDCEEKTTFVFDESELTSYTYEGEDCEIEEILIYEFTLEGDTLTLRTEDIMAEYTIEKLTESTLQLSYQFDDFIYGATFERQ